MLCLLFCVGNVCGVCFCVEFIEVMVDCGENMLGGGFWNFLYKGGFLGINDFGMCWFWEWNFGKVKCDLFVMLDLIGNFK